MQVVQTTNITLFGKQSKPVLLFAVRVLKLNSKIKREHLSEMYLKVDKITFLHFKFIPSFLVNNFYLFVFLWILDVEI